MCPRLTLPTPPTHVDLEGMALRAPSGAVVGRSGRKGKRDCRGCQDCAVARVASRWSPAAAADVRHDTQYGIGGLGLEMIRAEDAMRGLGLSQR